MANDDRTYADILASTARDDERWRIQQFGDRQRDKWPPDPTLAPGLERRRNRDWFDIMSDIADFQAAHGDLATLLNFNSRVGLRIMMLVWPKFVDPRAIRGSPALKRRIRAARKRRPIADEFFSFFVMATARYPSVATSIPVISIRHRKPSDMPDFGQEMSVKLRNDIANEIIGRAVLQDYRESQSIESSWEAIAAIEEIDGIRPGGLSNVKRRYLAYRKLAFDRGFADLRAYWAQSEQAPWPLDQVWLDEFPK